MLSIDAIYTNCCKYFLILLEGLILVGVITLDNQYTELRHTATHSQIKVILPQSALQECNNSTGVAVFNGVTV
jgi:hypothetical protein